MTYDPAGRADRDPYPLPPVDQVIHDVREAATTHAPTETHHEPRTSQGGHDEHAPDHAAEALGPVDTAQWAAGLVGVTVGLVVAACFVLAVQGLAAY